MKCYYHSKDLDGICSGAIAKYKYPNIELIGYDYGQEFDINLISEGETIIMADVSLPMDLMKDISIKTNGNFTWIDHHKSAIDDFNNYQYFKDNPDSIKVIHQIGISACELTWKYLFPHKEVPYIVQLLSAYDVWDHERFDWDKLILPIQYGVRLDCENDVNKFNPNIFKYFNDEPYYNFFQMIYNSGKNVLKYQISENTRYAKLHAFEDNIKGYRAICINGIGSSMMFDTVFDSDKHDIMVLFSYMRDHWTFTIYSENDNVDCSLIAKHFGGGGHMHAAGFQVVMLSDVFPYKIFI